MYQKMKTRKKNKNVIPLTPEIGSGQDIYISIK